MKITLSVNVLSLYSASEGKYGSWMPSGSLELKRKGFEPGNIVCISLIKCYVVDCNGPFYSI